jgi:hypothetical protein
MAIKLERVHHPSIPCLDVAVHVVVDQIKTVVFLSSALFADTALKDELKANIWPAVGRSLLASGEHYTFYKHKAGLGSRIVRKDM